MSAREELVRALEAEWDDEGRTYIPQHRLHALPGLILRVIDEAFDAHCENRPHIHADGSES